MRLKSPAGKVMVCALGVMALGLPLCESASMNLTLPKSIERGSISAGRALPCEELGRSSEQSKQPSVGWPSRVEAVVSYAKGRATELAAAVFVLGGASVTAKVRSWNGVSE